MRKTKEVFRLKFDCHLSNRKIAESCLIARSTVAEYLSRFQQAALSWPLPEAMDDTRLEELLFPATSLASDIERPLPDWLYIHNELRRKGVTLALLWQEHKAQHPAGYQYSQFCYWYRQWAKKIDPVMRQEHRAGEKLFVDYAGMTVPVYDRQAAKTREA